MQRRGHKTYGRGPWYICTLVNFVTKEVQVRVHTYGFRIPAILNELDPTAYWYLDHMIGPYSVLEDAIEERQVAGIKLYRRKEPVTAVPAKRVLEKPIASTTTTMKEVKAIKKRRKK